MESRAPPSCLGDKNVQEDRAQPNEGDLRRGWWEEVAPDTGGVQVASQGDQLLWESYRVAVQGRC